MRYRLLGPLQVTHQTTLVDIGAPKQRAVLAALLLARGHVVSTDRLIDRVWGGNAPVNATANLQVYISNLRRVLSHGCSLSSPILRQSPGYYFDVESADQIDVTVVEHGCQDARQAVADHRWHDVLSATETVLALWRGSLLEDFADEDWVRHEAVRVGAMFCGCLEDQITALLALDRLADAVTDAARLRLADPMGERGCWLQMLVLYRMGRDREALDVFRRHATCLDEELGLRPGPELRDLQTAILRHSTEFADWPAHVATRVLAPPSGIPPDATERREGVIGRSNELASIAEVLDECSGGVTRWLILTGPAGIGKTRLAEEAARMVSAAGGVAVWVGCPDDNSAPPWWPMRQLVRALGADADEVLRAASDADPDTARFGVYERVQMTLETSPALPLAIVIDDAHWADSTSTSCLAYIAGALRDRPVMFVVTMRDGEHRRELSRLMATAARSDGTRHIEVPPLTAGNVVALARQVADDVITDAEGAELVVRTGGNPFFISEYARLPREVRAGSEIPLAVRSVLTRRLAGLAPGTLQVLRTAAVIGDRFDLALLARTAELDLETLVARLDEAADQRIVADHGDNQYVFVHDLLRETLAAGMPATQRRRMHAKAADALSDGMMEDASTRRARHLVAALPLVDPTVVVDACRSAAEHATQQWSSEIAARWWQAALSAYDLIGPSAQIGSERDGLVVARLEALIRAGRGQTVLDAVEANISEALQGRRPETAGRMASALLRVRGAWPWVGPGQDPAPLLGSLQRAARLSAGQPSVQARIWSAVAVGHCYHPDASVAREYLSRATELAEKTGDPEVIADALMGHLITYTGVASHSRQALGWSDRLIALPHSRNREDAVIAHSIAAIAAMNLADITAAQRHLRAGIAGSEELQLPVLRAQLRWMEAISAVWRGDFPEAERQHAIATRVHYRTDLYDAGTRLVAEVSLLRETGGPVDASWPAREGVDPGVETMVDMVQTAVQTIKTGSGEREEAAATLTRGIAASHTHVWTTLGHTVLLAHLCTDHQLPEFAPPLLRELEPFADRIALIGHIGIVGPVALATARLHAAMGHRALAIEHLGRAHALAERTGGRPSLLRCRLMACEMEDWSPGTGARAQAIEVDARRLGMHGVADEARRMALHRA